MRSMNVKISLQISQITSTFQYGRKNEERMGLKSLDEPNVFFAKLYPSSPLSNNTLKTNHYIINNINELQF